MGRCEGGGLAANEIMTEKLPSLRHQPLGHIPPIPEQKPRKGRNIFNVTEIINRIYVMNTFFIQLSTLCTHVGSAHLLKNPPSCVCLSRSSPHVPPRLISLLGGTCLQVDQNWIGVFTFSGSKRNWRKYWRQRTGKNGGFQGFLNNPQIRVLYRQILFHGKMIYSKPNTGSDCLFPIRFWDQREISVHAHCKYCLNRLFRQNTSFNRDSGMLT